MSSNIPKPGMIIGYSYLWKKEHDEGRETARKDRPCLVLAVRENPATNKHAVAVLPITQTEPQDRSGYVEIPAQVKRMLGLKDQRAWINCKEFNEFTWPGYDLAHIRMADGSMQRECKGGITSKLWGQVREEVCSRIKDASVTFERVNRDTPGIAP